MTVWLLWCYQDVFDNPKLVDVFFDPVEAEVERTRLEAAHSSWDFEIEERKAR